MTRIKICGITSKSDIKILNRHLPDYAGFVFAESRRRVSAEKVQDLAGELDYRIKKVGVFVNADPEEIAQITGKVGLDVVQLHGDENRDYIAGIRKVMKPGTEIWKAIKIAAVASGVANDVSEAGKDFSELDSLKIKQDLEETYMDRILVDSFVKGMQGGTGVCFDWRLLDKLVFGSNIILAGGLNPSNVGEAISILKPYAVDVSSGVEMDGVKDGKLVMEFIRNVRGG